MHFAISCFIYIANVLIKERPMYTNITWKISRPK